MSLLLSPAGSPESLDAAIEAGADEVYLGGGSLNARIGARNFDDAALVRAGEKCRANGVGLCITLNTLVTDRQLAEALDFADFLQREVRPYAYIVQDLGLAMALKRRFPDITLHASTQAQQHSSGGVRLLRDLGFSRVVLARETDRDGIAAVAATGIETEVFIHGALCVSQSGGCLMSSFIGKRSGNRGECAQPCRLDYAGKNRYPLSLRDLCLASHIPELLDLGVTALKIEGRMKSPEYVYTVTRVYRRLIDEHRAATPRDLDTLKGAFSRSGFTDGFFVAKPDRGMFGVHNNSETPVYLARKPLSYTRPPIVSHETSLTVPTRDESACLPASQQRGGVLRFAFAPGKEYTACGEKAARIDIPVWLLDNQPFPPEKVSAVLPRTIYESESAAVKKLLDRARERGITQVTLSNPAHIPLCDGFVLHADMLANITNVETVALYGSLSFSSVSLSAEISPSGHIETPMALEYPVWGRLPLMHTAVCIIKNLGRECAPSGCCAVLADRKNARFPVRREFGHRNIIYNSVPLDLLDRCRDLRRAGVGLYTMYITDESPEAVAQLFARMEQRLPPSGSFTRGYYTK